MSLLNVARQETARALKAKERGNVLYRAGRFQEAVHMYGACIFNVLSFLAATHSPCGPE
jgi:hypothetical protein